jgi:hypothetical protein
MYFNKKYNHTGPLFDGPYKSTPITDLSRLEQAAAEIHSIKTSDRIPEKYSSYGEYAGKRTTFWIKPVKQQKPGSEKQKSIPVAVKQVYSKQDKPKPIKFFAASFTIFVLLFAIGLMNINISSITAKAPMVAVLIPTPSPSSIMVATPIPMVAAAEDENSPPKIEVEINIGENLKSVNLREKATTSSKLVGTAINGDTFEYISETPGWYKIMLKDGAAYVSTNYAQKKGEAIN